MQTILDFGVRLIVALQGLGDWQTLPMKLFSFLGTEEFFMLALPILYWCVDSFVGHPCGRHPDAQHHPQWSLQTGFSWPTSVLVQSQCARPGCRDILRHSIEPCPKCRCGMGHSGGLLAQMVGLAGCWLAYFSDRAVAAVPGSPLSTGCIAWLADRRPDPLADAAILGSGGCLGKKTRRQAGRSSPPFWSRWWCSCCP